MLKRIGVLFLVLIFGITSYAKEEPIQLHARSAVLMDADTGRILFEKNGETPYPMASTTKIMTCILALENNNLDDIVTVSKNAAKQPRVHLGAQEGELYRLKDLLYSLMLESHNDSAVMIAELVGGSLEYFQKMMNEKAKEIGCENTYFITPSGLDANDKNGIHATSASDLAKIMSYCITESEMKDEFLKITGTRKYEFTDMEQKHQFTCYNHNAFLTMMEGAISGKTGFTGEAGYCYVGALRRDKKTFVVALLGCGWPNHKTYKWQDTKLLMEYGLKNYEYREIPLQEEQMKVKVKYGITPSEVKVMIKDRSKNKAFVLMKKDENVVTQTVLKKQVKAPVKKGQKLGSISYYIDGTDVRKLDLVANETIDKKTVVWCLHAMFLRLLQL